MHTRMICSTAILTACDPKDLPSGVYEGDVTWAEVDGLLAIGGRLEISQHPCLAAADAEALVTRIGEANIAGEIVLTDNDGPC